MTQRIVIIDDQASSRAAVESMLRGDGYVDLLAVNSVEDAFASTDKDSPGQAKGRLDGRPADIVLLDLNLPGVSGIEVCRMLKSQPAMRDVPIIIVSPREDMAALEAAFAAGASDFITKPVDRVELRARVRSALAFKNEHDMLKRREVQLMRAARKLADANAHLRRISAQDGLTGLANRRRFDQTLIAEWRRATRKRNWLAVVMADIDHFKAYNDLLGHQAGDECLKLVAKALPKAVGRSTDLVARYGGEEFAAVLPDTDVDGALAVAERMRLHVAWLALPHPGSPVASHVTISLGLAAGPAVASREPTDLVAQADAALYAAKAQGRNRVVVQE